MGFLPPPVLPPACPRPRRWRKVGGRYWKFCLVDGLFAPMRWCWVRGLVCEWWARSGGGGGVAGWGDGSRSVLGGRRGGEGRARLVLRASVPLSVKPSIRRLARFSLVAWGCCAWTPPPSLYPSFCPCTGREQSSTPGARCRAPSRGGGREGREGRGCPSVARWFGWWEAVRGLPPPPPPTPRASHAPWWWR